MSYDLAFTARHRHTALLATVCALAACSKSAQKPPTTAVPVIVTPASRADVPYDIKANGVVSPVNTSSITAQVDGLITHVFFREGQEVDKGAQLFQIEDRPYRAAYSQALANLTRDKETNANAQKEVARYESLVKQDYVTQEQADQQKATAGAALATVQADEAALENAKFNLDNTKIRAPIAGRTGGLLVREGNVVHAGGTTPLVVINQISPILVRFPIPSTDLPLIQRYGTSGQLPVTALPAGVRQTSQDTTGGPPGMGGDAPPDQASGVDPSAVNLIAQLPPARGTLYFIDNSVDTLTGTVMLKATFDNAERMLWSGQFVATTLHLFVEQKALVVPTEAVVTGQQGTYVYVIDSASTAQQRKVSVERSQGSVSVITAGLRDGEQVVRSGQSRLNSGAKVKIATVADTAGAPAARGAGKGGLRKPATS
ncbi:MAG: efflux RND transporter periplasmic adaptor subunit [Gemmatimonadota bacterium]|nr:efflux RND transporter periplasmic adaptor subunit [Gemmatimonadota bacterium]